MRYSDDTQEEKPADMREIEKNVKQSEETLSNLGDQ